MSIRMDRCLLCSQEMYPPLLDEYEGWLKNPEFLRNLIDDLQELLAKAEKEVKDDET